MTKPILGMIECPICHQNNATVHQNAVGRNKEKRLYMRCYAARGGSDPLCGTLQCYGPKGQEYILANVRPIGELPEISEAFENQQEQIEAKTVEAAAEEDFNPEEQVPPPEKKHSFIGWVLGETE